MKINPYVFRAYDIRGIYGEDINEDLFKKIGFVLGGKKEKILVGNDIRRSGKKLANALIKGLKGARTSIIYAGTASFGETLFAGWKLKAKKTLFVTASHLPSQWNGLKIYYGDGEPFSEDEIKKLRNAVINVDKIEVGKNRGGLKKINIKEKYLRFLSDKFADIKKCNLKIVIDCGNGSVSLIAPELFKRLGFRVIELYCKPDPSFPNRDPEPTIKNVKALVKKVKQERADFGVAFDGDGDRGVIVDDRGRYLNGNQIGIILGKNILLASDKKNVVKTVACSMAVEEELKPLGARIIEMPVGHTYVISGSKKYKACLGMEETSHMVMPRYFLFDDAIIVPLKIAEIIFKERKKLSDVVSKIKIYPFEEIVFNCADEKKFKVMKELTLEFKRKYGKEKINTLDGVKLNFDYGWILIRASNTSPKIRLYIETKTREKFNLLKQKFSEIISKKI